MNIVRKHLKATGQKDKIQAYMNDAMSGGYDRLLEVSQEYYPELEYVRVR